MVGWRQVRGRRYRLRAPQGLQTVSPSRVFLLSAFLIVACVMTACAERDRRGSDSSLRAPDGPEVALTIAPRTQSPSPLPDAVAEASPPAEEGDRLRYIQGALNPPMDPVIKGRHKRATGTGFFVSPHKILTNDHVVARCSVVTSQFGKRQDAPLVVALTKSDHEHDLAVLTSSVAAADSVIFEGRLERVDTSDLSVIGFPEHGLPTLRPSIVAAVAKPSVIAIDAPLFPFYADIHPGHSGSPLLNEYGAVVGVVTAKIDTVTTFQRTAEVVTNIGFAIPHRTVLAFLQESHVEYHVGAPSESLTREERMERFRNSIAQIICWE